MSARINVLGDKFRRLMDVPEDEVCRYRYYRDLTCEPVEKPSSPESGQSLHERVQESIQDPFDQIEELAIALDTFEAEIRRDDFAILRDEKPRPHAGGLINRVYVTYAINRYRIIVAWAISLDHQPEATNTRLSLMNKIEKLAILALGHISLDINEEGLFTYFSLIDSKFTQAYESLGVGPVQNLYRSAYCSLLEEFGTPPESEYGILSDEPQNGYSSPYLINLVVLRTYFQSSMLSDKLERKFQGLIHYRVHELCALENLSPDQVHFINHCFRKNLIAPDKFQARQVIAHSEREYSVFTATHEISAEHTLKSLYRELLIIRRYSDHLKRVQAEFPAVRTACPSLSSKLKQECLEFFVYHMPCLALNPELAPMLKELSLDSPNPQTYFRSLLGLCVMKMVRQDPKTYTSSGLLVPDGESLSLSEGWMKALELLTADPAPFLEDLFSFSHANPRMIDPKQIEVSVRFLKGASVLNYLPYLLDQAMNPYTPEVLSDLAAQRIVHLDREMSLKVAALLKERQMRKFSPTLKECAKLLKAAKAAQNKIIQEACYLFLSQNITPYFIPGKFKDDKLAVEQLGPLQLDEEDLIEVIKLLDPTKIQKNILDRKHNHLDSRFLVEAPLRDRVLKHALPLIAIDVRMFPGMTPKILAEFITKIPMLNVENLDEDKDSALTDVHLTDGKGQTIYANSAVLIRSCEYFKMMLKGAFKEGREFNEHGRQIDKKVIQLSEADFEFMKRWMLLFKEPLRLELTPPSVSVTLAESIQMLAAAKRLLLTDHMLKALDEYYTAKIKPLLSGQTNEIELEEGVAALIDELKGTSLYRQFRDDPT